MTGIITTSTCKLPTRHSSLARANSELSFVDCNMFMRFFGGGVGHVHQGVAAGATVHDQEDEEEMEAHQETLTILQGQRQDPSAALEDEEDEEEEEEEEEDDDSDDEEGDYEVLDNDDLGYDEHERLLGGFPSTA